MNDIFSVDYDINVPKLVEDKDIIKFGENLVVEKGLYKKRGDLFYDIILKSDNEEIFLGRFPKEQISIDIAYNNGKIMIYQKKFDKIRDYKVIKVISLYEILDKTFYSCTEKEALTIFDQNADTSWLINGDNSIVRTDIEKLRRIK